MGHHPDSLADWAKAAGHASAKRAEVPHADWIEIIQAERIVEAFEADLWSGGTGDVQGLRDMAASGCWQSHVPALDLSDEQVIQVRREIAAFSARWAETKVGAGQTLVWSPAS
jgi:hypothetical protein